MKDNFKNRRNTISWASLVVALLLVVSSDALAFPVRFGVGPDNNQDLLLSHIRSAQSRLTINIYLFDHPAIAEAVIEQIQAGVTVRLLVESQPFGRISANGRLVLAALQNAIAGSPNPDNELLLMGKPDDLKTKRRYRYNHAKYVIADGERSLISSENFTDSGHTETGTIGNRGWDVVVNNPDLASELEDIFNEDTDRRFGDVKDFTDATSSDLPEAKAAKPRSIAGVREGSGDAEKATLVLSPNSLDSLVQLIRSAKSTLSMEHMSMPSNWAAPNKGQNPVVTELIHAAQRGVKVRVLLNDESVFGRPTTKSTSADDDEEEGEIKKRPNQVTVELLNSIGKDEDLSLAGRIINIKRAGVSYIHNKGIIVDGKRALVSSINGSQTSVMKNREIAVLLESPDAAAYYGSVFDFDWKVSSQIKPAETASFQILDFFKLYGSQ